MKTPNRLLLITLALFALFAMLFFVHRWLVDDAFGKIGESMVVPSQLIKTVRLGEDEYALFYSPGAASTAREGWVNKNGRLIYRITSHDGQIEDLVPKHGGLYLVGQGVGDVDLSKESYK